MWFARKPYQNLNLITVSAKALHHNYQQLSRIVKPALVAPVLKSNAYGHGLILSGRFFDSFQAPFLVVDSLYEAFELHKAGVKSRILILGYTKPANYRQRPWKKLPFDYTVFDLASAQALNRWQKGSRVHLFVDTGMCREGVTLAELPSFLTELKQLKNLQLVGLASHLADADNPKNQDFTQLQIANFKQALQLLQQHGFVPQWRHLSASAGTLKITDPVFNLCRVGLANYGLSPLAKTDRRQKNIYLRPALEFRTHIAQIKTIHRGDKVSYNGTYTAKKKMRIAILPAGYYDGLDRRLSDRGWVKIRKQFCPIIGRVCMNLTVVDISQLKTVRVGDPVIIYSKNQSDKNSLNAAAELCQTIPYDLLVHLAASTKRLLV